MDSKRSALLSGGSEGRWDDRPPPVSPPYRPHEREAFERGSSLGGELPSEALPSHHPRELPSVAEQKVARRAAARAWLLAPVVRVRTAIVSLAGRLRPDAGKEAVTTGRSWPSPFAFARYLLVFFAGVIVTVVWQSQWQSPRGEPQPLAAVAETPAVTPPPVAAATPADIEQMRQSIDRLTAEVGKIRTTQQGILDKVSAAPPPPPPAAPARNAQQRAGTSPR